MPQHKKQNLWPIAAALFLALSYVLMGVWVRMMQDSFATWQQIYLRILLAAVLAVIVFRKSLHYEFWRQISPKDWSVYGTRAILAYVVGVGGFTIAVQHAQLNTVSFVSSLPLLGLIAWIMYREKLRLVTLPFILLSVVGLALLTGVTTGNLHLGLGETAAIIGMLGFDVGYLLSRYHNKNFSNFQNTTVLLLVAWIPLLMVSLARGESLTWHHVTLEGWAGLVISAVMNVVGLYLINYVFGRLKAYVTGNLLLTEGVFAIVIGFVFYGEVPAVMNLVGAAVILACAFAVSVLDARGDRLEAALSENEQIAL